MKYHAPFVIFEKVDKFEIIVYCKLQVALYGLKPSQGLLLIVHNKTNLIPQPKHMLWVLKKTV